MFVHTHAYSHTQSLLGKGRVRDSCATQGPTELQAAVLTARPKVPSDAQEQPGDLSAGEGDQEVVSHSSQEGVRNKSGFPVLPPESLIWVYSLVGSLVKV